MSRYQSSNYSCARPHRRAFCVSGLPILGSVLPKSGISPGGSVNSVDVKRVPEGYVVSRAFASEAAAQRATDLLMSVNEAAFVPAGGPHAYDAHPFNPPRTDTGD